MSNARTPSAPAPSRWPPENFRAKNCCARRPTGPWSRWWTCPSAKSAPSANAACRCRTCHTIWAAPCSFAVRERRLRRRTRRWRISSPVWTSRISDTWCPPNDWSAPALPNLDRTSRNETRKSAWEETSKSPRIISRASLASDPRERPQNTRQREKKRMETTTKNGSRIGTAYLKR